MLYNSPSQSWTQIAKGGGFLKWSGDGAYIYFLRQGPETAVMRVRTRDKKVEEVASLRGIRLAGRLAGIALALTPERDPIVLRVWELRKFTPSIGMRGDSSDRFSNQRPVVSLFCNKFVITFEENSK